jgi:hypothetical protein
MLLPYAGASDAGKWCLRRGFLFGKVINLDNQLVFYGVKDHILNVEICENTCKASVPLFTLNETNNEVLVQYLDLL